MNTITLARCAGCTGDTCVHFLKGKCYYYGEPQEIKDTAAICTQYEPKDLQEYITKLHTLIAGEA